MRKVVSEKAGGGTFKCPICGTKVLIASKYCMKCKKKVTPPAGTKEPAKKDDKKDDKKKEALNLGAVYEIFEAVKIRQENCDILLEDGDRIQIIKENNYPDNTDPDGIYKAKDGNFYYQISWGTSDEGDFQYNYGPFKTDDEAKKWLKKKQHNWKDVKSDDSGKRKVPKSNLARPQNY